LLAFFTSPDIENGTLPDSRTIRILIAAAVAMLCGCSKSMPFANGASATAFPSHPFDHFILIVLENEDAATIERIPYMDSLGRAGATLRAYFAVAHPSYPNYLALVAGRTFSTADPGVKHDPEAYSARDFGDAQLLIDAPTIADRLESKGLTWDAFAEDYPDTSATPSACYFGRARGNYARKHVPFLSFTEFHTRPQMCAHVRNLRWFNKDSLAAYTFITPNMIHDGHDAPIDSAVTWLRSFLVPILADSAVMRSTVIAITFDESASTFSDRFRGSRANRVFAVLLGGPIKPGADSDFPLTHYSMLRTVEENFDLAPSLVPANTRPIVGVWNAVSP
jgi:hypothetical protein